MTEHVRSILLVDDDKDGCANMADILAELGYEVDIAYEGQTALALVRRRLYDVAILDLKLPSMDGLTLYREIKKLQAGTTSFLVTAYADAATASDAVAAGVSRVLPKPIDLPRLLSMIDDAMKRPLLLVVDADDDLCESLWELLSGRGYRVCIAHDGRQAMKRLRSSTQVVLIALKLPDIDGLDVSRLVRVANPEVRVILITGNRAELAPNSARLRDEGVDAVFSKPFDIPTLLGTVEELIENEER